MAFRFDAEQMGELMRAFYTLTGIRFVLFDADFREIIAYPEQSCAFCRLMKGCPKTRRRCNYADRRSFEKCRQQDQPVLYRCHAGLVEAVLPLHENEGIIGYLMFGQINAGEDKSGLYQRMADWSVRYGFDVEALEACIGEITCKTDEQIAAAVKIMEAVTSYIIYKELIQPQQDVLLDKAKAYIEEHLAEDIRAEQISKALGIGRTRLYEIFKSELHTGVSAYLLRRRLHRGKKLLKTTDLSVAEIADRVGFTDYNYFSRVFKKTYGKSPKSYR